MKNTKSWRNKIVAAAVIVALFTGATAVPGVSPLDIFPTLSASAANIWEIDGAWVSVEAPNHSPFTLTFEKDGDVLKIYTDRNINVVSDYERGRNTKNLAAGDSFSISAYDLTHYDIDIATGTKLYFQRDAKLYIKFGDQSEPFRTAGNVDLQEGKIHTSRFGVSGTLTVGNGAELDSAQYYRFGDGVSNINVYGTLSGQNGIGNVDVHIKSGGKFVWDGTVQAGNTVHFDNTDDTNPPKFEVKDL